MSPLVARRSVAVLAVVAGLGAGCRPGARDRDEHDARGAADNAPVVAPSRLADDSGTAVVMIPDSQRTAFGLALAPLRSGTARTEQRLVGEVVAEPERVTTLRAPVAGRLRLVGD